MRGHLKDCVDRLFFGWLNETAGIDDDDVRFFWFWGDLKTVAWEGGEHHLTVH